MEFITRAAETLLIAVFSAAVSAWITVHLSRNKFRSERWWEKRFEAYEKVINAFHFSKKFYSEHSRERLLRTTLEEERSKELHDEAQEARDEILRASDVGSFLLSQDALRILAKYEAESENIPRQESWEDYLDLAWSIVNRYMNQFIEVSRTDLNRKVIK